MTLNTIKNERLTGQIKEALGDLYGIFKRERAFLAGGAVTSLFCNREVNDWDIYFRNKYSTARVLVDAVHTNEELSPYSCMVHSITKKSVSCSYNDRAVQFITFRYFNTAEEIFSTFDFTVCMGAYCFDKEEFLLDCDFLVHNSQRYLKYNPQTAYPLISALRVQKYTEKGYTISKLEMMRILASITSIKIKSWEGAEEHLGGMYGETITQLESASGAFSMEKLLDALGNHSSKEINPTIKTYTDLSALLCNLGIEIPKLYYKRVGEDCKSIYSSHGSITYTEGSIVNGGTNGIYCYDVTNKDELIGGYYRGPRVVVLEPQEGCKYDGRALIGDVLVKRVVHEDSDEAKEILSYDFLESVAGDKRKDNKEDDYVFPF